MFPNSPERVQVKELIEICELPSLALGSAKQKHAILEIMRKENVTAEEANEASTEIKDLKVNIWQTSVWLVHSLHSPPKRAKQGDKLAKDIDRWNSETRAGASHPRSEQGLGLHFQRRSSVHRPQAFDKYRPPNTPP